MGADVNVEQNWPDNVCLLVFLTIYIYSAFFWDTFTFTLLFTLLSFDFAFFWDNKIKVKLFIFVTNRKYVLAFWQIWPVIMMYVSKWWEIKILCKFYLEKETI